MVIVATRNMANMLAAVANGNGGAVGEAALAAAAANDVAIALPVQENEHAPAAMVAQMAPGAFAFAADSNVRHRRSMLNSIIQECERALEKGGAADGICGLEDVRSVVMRLSIRRRVTGKKRPAEDMCGTGSTGRNHRRGAVWMGDQGQSCKAVLGCTAHAVRSLVYASVRTQYSELDNMRSGVQNRQAPPSHRQWSAFISDYKFLWMQDLVVIMGVTTGGRRPQPRIIRKRFAAVLKTRMMDRLEVIRMNAISELSALEENEVEEGDIRGGVALENHMTSNVRVWRLADVQSRRQRPKYKAACTITWNGSWLETDEAWQQYCRSRGPDEEVDTAGYSVPAVGAFAARFSAWFRAKIQALKIAGTCWSWCMERSTQSCAGRIHLHAFLNTPLDKMEQAEVHKLLRFRFWKFDSVQPHISALNGGCTWRMTANMIGSGHYYVQAPKFGRVYGESNYQACVHYILPPTCPWKLWQQGKMGSRMLQRELLRTRDVRAPTLLTALSSIREEERAALEEEEMQRLLARLEAEAAPSKEYDIVNTWKEQYMQLHGENNGRLPRRFKFLVLNGPSRMGKTVFAQRLFGVESTLMVDCQGVDVPSLRSFDRSRHKAVVFDEICDSAILNCKKMFQAGVDVNELSQSTCNQHAYRRWLYGIAMIVSCNTWLQGPLRETDKAWLLENSIVLDVTAPMWVEAVGGAAD